ncbi:AI-2E family transporter [uncultured Tissierella sp.]|uniref:AI-2E family transporter n=1 Tax=uncultured Tissierella sp. TaxID=448160 RepID=UPI0028044176|nr:AI-2E family transporter [uncultured Tissierella sp.]MDU5081555.1 AI-2E family transporter [Bacillota bacterium]
MDNKKDFLKQIMNDTGKGIKGYMKAQVTLMIITFIILGIGLTIIDAKHPILISAGIAILDIIPVLGAGIVMIPWAVINFIIGNKDMGADLATLYVILVILRQFIEPKIVGKEIGVRPLYTFIATILGSIILGPVGIILGPLVAVIISSIMKTKKKTDNRR